ncbi:MAG: hypothetical protein ACLVJ6_08390 [Merdibacter sp.]
MFRWPDLFNGTIGLSGIYSSKWYFGGYMDDLVYNNPRSIILIRCRPIIVWKIPALRYRAGCGQGDWEQEAQQDTRRMQNC